MQKMNNMNEKFKNDEPGFNLVKNENLVCKDCEYRYDDKDMPCNTSKCDKFPAIKLVEVLDGKDCTEYKHE